MAELVGRQVAEFLLYGPEGFKHDVRPESPGVRGRFAHSTAPELANLIAKGCTCPQAKRRFWFSLISIGRRSISGNPERTVLVCRAVPLFVLAMPSNCRRLLMALAVIAPALAPSLTPVLFAQASAPAAIGKYNGAGSCAASSCHGSVQPKTVTRIFQNEYTIWAGQDKHANAFSVLSNPVSLRIGRILKIGRPDQAQKCLICHSLDVPKEKRAQTFGMEDGVSCENCHGPASGWLGPHTTANWP